MSDASHFFSVDVEEYFQVNAFEAIAPRERWLDHTSRLDVGLDAILNALARAGARGTFFTLGWVAARRPDVIRRISTAGHEIACHGFWHRRVVTLTPEQFRDDLRDAKSTLEDALGASVLGFRAPSFSIIPGYEWAFDVLIEEGFRYDSSRFPIRRPGYGSPGTPREPHDLVRPTGRLLEIPLATLNLAGAVIPAAGGGYLRQLPFAVIRRAFRDATKANVPAMFYIHPWELDPGQPRLAVPLLTRIRHYGGLSRSLTLIRRLLDEFKFTSVAEYYGDRLMSYGGRS